MAFRIIHSSFASSMGSLMILIGLTMPSIAALPPAGAISLNPDVAHLVSDAQKAASAGDFRLAIIYLKNASSADPRNGRVRAQLGKVLLESGDYASAEDELRIARRDKAPEQLVMPLLLQSMLALNENNMLLDEFPEPLSPFGPGLEILKARSLALLNLGQIPEATTTIEKALQVRRDVPGLLIRARIAQNAGVPALALQTANAALAIDPGNVEALLFKASLLVDSKDFSGALALTNRVLAKSPSNLAAQFSLIDMLMRTKQDKRARTMVDAILLKYPDIPIAIYYRALLLARSGDNKGAWHIAQGLSKKFITSEPPVAISVSRMANIAGDSETSASILGLAVSRYPQNNQLRIQLAAARLGQNDINAALDAIRPINAPDPDTALAMAGIFVRCKRPDLALEVLQRLEQTGKATDAVTLGFVGLESAMGQRDQALKDLSDAASHNPDDPLLANQLISALAAHKRFDDALDITDKLSKDPTKRLLSLILRGQLLLAQNKFDDALKSFDAALQENPKSEAALFGKAIVFEQMGRLNDALSNIHLILKIDSRNVSAYLKLADIAARMNDDKAVRSALGEAAKTNPRDPAPNLALARYLAGRHDPGGALKAARGALSIRSQNADALELIGKIDLAMGKNLDAVAAFRRLTALASDTARAEILLGNALLAIGDQQGATAALKKAVSLAPTSAEVRQAQINLLLAEKDTGSAIESARAYQKENPGTQADILLGDTLGRTGHRDEAITVYRKSFSAHPVSITLLRLAGTAAYNGDTNTAAEVLSRWIKDNRNDTAVRLAYASLLIQQSKNDDAIGQLREVLKIDPNNVHALNNLAWLTGDKDPKNAIALAKRATALAANSAQAFDTLGWLQSRHGNGGEGLSALKKAHDLSPDDGEISYHLALSLYATGDREAARGFLKALLASQAKFADRQEAIKLAKDWH